MTVIFAPDYREADPYQTLLASALNRRGVRVDFLQGYRRGLPLARSLRRRKFDILHLHWPEAYYPRLHDGRDGWRLARYGQDLHLARRGRPLIYTAHNLLPHDRERGPSLRAAVAATFRQARFVIAHTAAARESVIHEFAVPTERVSVIPMGDHTAALPQPIPRAIARKQLDLPEDTPICLMPGTLRPYKGIEEVIEAWGDNWPAHLHIAGSPLDNAYTHVLKSSAASHPNVHLHPQRQSDDALRDWLCASNCAIVNYANVFSSGIAPMVRSWGLPLLIPSRLSGIELGEPSPRVLRFDKPSSDLRDRLAEALLAPEDPADLAAWRRSVAWDPIAGQTLELYRKAVA